MFNVFNEKEREREKKIDWKIRKAAGKLGCVQDVRSITPLNEALFISLCEFLLHSSSKFCDQNPKKTKS